MVEADPLKAFPYSWAFICENAFLVEPERLFLRVSANLAVRARRYKGDPELLDLLAEVQESSIKELMEEDLEAERNGWGIDPENLPGFRFLIPEETGIEAQQSRRATVVFNHLEEENRRAFFHVIAEGWSVEDYAEENGLSVDEVIDQISETTQIIVRGCIAPNDHGDPLGDGPKEELP